MAISGASREVEGHWTAIRRDPRGGYAHADSVSGVARVTADEAAALIRDTSTAGGVVMMVWPVVIDHRRAFLTARATEAEAAPHATESPNPDDPLGSPNACNPPPSLDQAPGALPAHCQGAFRTAKRGRRDDCGLQQTEECWVQVEGRTDDEWKDATGNPTPVKRPRRAAEDPEILR